MDISTVLIEAHDHSYREVQIMFEDVVYNKKTCEYFECYGHECNDDEVILNLPVAR